MVWIFSKFVFEVIFISISENVFLLIEII